jgi:hypothetical protein
MCSLVNLPLVLPHATKVPKVLTKPATLHNILGDGNCLFQALSYVITGRQVYHSVVRYKILDHMRTIENQLLPHMNMSLSNYIQSSGIWAEKKCGGLTFKLLLLLLCLALIFMCMEVQVIILYGISFRSQCLMVCSLKA